MEKRRSLLGFWITFGALFVSFISFLYWFFQPEPYQPKGLVKVQLAYPITSHEPINARDWETIFVNNHIFPRLVPPQNESNAKYISSGVEVSCVVPKGNQINDSCEKVRLTFAPNPFSDCMGRKYTVNDLRDEFEQLLRSESWVLPNAKRCNDGPKRICVEGNYTADVQRRVHGVSFRFGWSKQKKTDPLFGAGPYCLTPKKRGKKGLLSGLLSPAKGFEIFPPIEFVVTQDPKNDFHFALYGSKKLLLGKRKNVQAHTPIGYYVVTNPSLASDVVPWNTEETQGIINRIFMREKVFFSAGANITQVFPAGLAMTQSRPNTGSQKQLEFVLPDYLPACKEVAEALNAAWKGQANAKAVCSDIISLVYEHVWKPNRDWDGFIVGVSQPDPGRNSVEYEFFSKDSRVSLVYDHPAPKELYYLAGVGQSIVTVDGERFCGVKPNLFGLGDIFVTDLLLCNGSWAKASFANQIDLE